MEKVKTGSIDLAKTNEDLQTTQEKLNKALDSVKNQLVLDETHTTMKKSLEAKCMELETYKAKVLGLLPSIKLLKEQKASIEKEHESCLTSTIENKDSMLSLKQENEDLYKTISNLKENNNIKDLRLATQSKRIKGNSDKREKLGTRVDECLKEKRKIEDLLEKVKETSSKYETQLTEKSIEMKSMTEDYAVRVKHLNITKVEVDKAVIEKSTEIKKLEDIVTTTKKEIKELSDKNEETEKIVIEKETKIKKLKETVESNKKEMNQNKTLKSAHSGCGKCELVKKELSEQTNKMSKLNRKLENKRNEIKDLIDSDQVSNDKLVSLEKKVEVLEKTVSEKEKDVVWYKTKASGFDRANKVLQDSLASKCKENVVLRKETDSKKKEGKEKGIVTESTFLPSKPGETTELDTILKDFYSGQTSKDSREDGEVEDSEKEVEKADEGMESADEATTSRKRASPEKEEPESKRPRGLVRQPVRLPFPARDGKPDRKWRTKACKFGSRCTYGDTCRYMHTASFSS